MNMVFLASVVALLLASANGLTFAEPATARPIKVIPPTYFGMHIHRADRGTPWPGRQIGSWRLWDANVTWADLEPIPDQWDFSRLDRYLAMANLTGTEVLMPLGMTPIWASARPTEKGTYRPHGDNAEPKNIGDWERYVRKIATRYKDRISHFEVWNEVNAGTGFFSGTPKAMFDLQKAAYRTVKAVDPAAVLVSPSSVGEAPHQLQWFENYLALGAGNYADVISYHFYQPRKKPEAIIELVHKVKATMGQHGAGDKPLWNTESGYSMDYGQKRVGAADPSWPALSPDVAEAYVSRALILGWWAGLDRFYWYAWDNSDLGFLQPDGKSSPAARAYLTVANWMVGTSMPTCSEKNDVWTCELIRARQRTWVVWVASDTAQSWRVSFDEARAVETLNGQRKLIPTNRQLTISGTPQLLKTVP